MVMVYQVKLSQYEHRRTVSFRLNFRDTNPFFRVEAADGGGRFPRRCCEKKKVYVLICCKLPDIIVCLNSSFLSSHRIVV